MGTHVGCCEQDHIAINKLINVLYVYDNCRDCGDQLEPQVPLRKNVMVVNDIIFEKSKFRP